MTYGHDSLAGWARTWSCSLQTNCPVYGRQQEFWCPPETRTEWEALGTLLERLCDPSAWKGYETNRGADQLRDKLCIHHFHLDERNRRRSNYRWFAFRSPHRFGNVWFSIGGTYNPRESLRDLWTSPVWFARIRELYPWVASVYRIRGLDGRLPREQFDENVKDVWHGNRSGVYGVVVVDNDVYLCPGMAREAPIPSDPDRWMVFLRDGASFAMYGEPDGEALLSILDRARTVMDGLSAR